MFLARLISRFFTASTSSDDNDFRLPRLGESRPSGHFREFTAPRRLQRGGLPGPRRGRAGASPMAGIIPCTGENIP